MVTLVTVGMVKDGYDWDCRESRVNRGWQSLWDDRDDLHSVDRREVGNGGEGVNKLDDVDVGNAVLGGDGRW